MEPCPWEELRSKSSWISNIYSSSDADDGFFFVLASHESFHSPYLHYIVLLPSHSFQFCANLQGSNALTIPQPRATHTHTHTHTHEQSKIDQPNSHDH